MGFKLLKNKHFYKRNFFQMMSTKEKLEFII